MADLIHGKKAAEVGLLNSSRALLLPGLFSFFKKKIYYSVVWPSAQF